MIDNFTKVKGWTYQNTHPRFVGDITGDGIDDIVGFYTDKVKTFVCLDDDFSGIIAVSDGNNEDMTVPIGTTADYPYIYPNPSAGTFRVKNINGSQYDRVILYDGIGRMADSHALHGEGVIDFSVKETGLYTVVLTGTKGTIIRKVIIQR